MTAPTLITETPDKVYLLQEMFSAFVYALQNAGIVKQYQSNQFTATEATDVEASTAQSFITADDVCDIVISSLSLTINITENLVGLPMGAYEDFTVFNVDPTNSSVKVHTHGLTSAELTEISPE
jgi:hypothetical protein